MKLTCAQMDVLLSFYIEGGLSKSLKNQVEDHLRGCATCRAKYDIIKSMVVDLKTSLNINPQESSKSFDNFETVAHTQQYNLFQENLSAYVDNELSSDESVKVKKFTINNPKARKALEDSFSIKRLMNNSFNKTKSETKQDFSRSVLKQLELEEETNLEFHPAIKFLIGFTLCVLILTTIVLFSLSV
jgi:anti-sigma factor RsiW